MEKEERIPSVEHDSRTIVEISLGMHSFVSRTLVVNRATSTRCYRAITVTSRQLSKVKLVNCTCKVTQPTSAMRSLSTIQPTMPISWKIQFTLISVQLSTAQIQSRVHFPAWPLRTTIRMLSVCVNRLQCAYHYPHRRQHYGSQYLSSIDDGRSRCHSITHQQTKSNIREH